MQILSFPNFVLSIMFWRLSAVFACFGSGGVGLVASYSVL